MLFSIALCTYNGAKYLREQLESIAIQTFLPDEMVVCDDRSQDDTLKILERFKSEAPFPVAIHQNEENLGSTRNFEKAILLCSGDIIVLCDQDDVWKPNKLERLEEAFQANPEAGYVFSDAELVDEDLKPLKRRLWDSYSFRGNTLERFLNRDQFNCFISPKFITGATLPSRAQKVISKLLVVHHYVTGATMAFRAEVGKQAMPFPTEGHWIHDGWIALVASSIGAWGVPINETLIDYRQHPHQQLGTPDPPPIIAKPLVREKRKSLLKIYREFKLNQKYLFDQWEIMGTRHIAIFSTIFEKLKELDKEYSSPELTKNLNYLNNYVKPFETHFLHRKAILTTKGPARYLLIIQEALSGRYGRFSNSWRSIFRDIFLG